MAGNLVNVDVGELSNGVFDLIKHLLPTEASRAAVQLKLMELAHAGDLAQIGVNAVEAKHENLFVSGWRPFIGWVCGFAFTYHFILQPFLLFIVWLAYPGADTSTIPEIDMQSLLVVLGGLLGLGGLRTYEKRTGTNHNRLRFPSKRTAQENAGAGNGGLM